LVGQPADHCEAGHTLGTLVRAALTLGDVRTSDPVDPARLVRARGCGPRRRPVDGLRLRGRLHPHCPYAGPMMPLLAHPACLRRGGQTAQRDKRQGGRHRRLHRLLLRVMTPQSRFRLARTVSRQTSWDYITLLCLVKLKSHLSPLAHNTRWFHC